MALEDKIQRRIMLSEKERRKKECKKASKEIDIRSPDEVYLFHKLD